MQNKNKVFGRKSLRTLLIIVGSMTAAFVIGIQTAGDVKPVIGSIQADDSQTAGDFNANGHLDVGDARIALELANGYRTPTPEELAADPNSDFSITTSDVVSILERLERAPLQPIVEY
jgi:hypothetical protein